MTSAMEYRVVYRSISLDRTIHERCVSVREAKVRVDQTWGRIEYREPGGVWQTLTEGDGATRSLGQQASGHGRCSDSPSVSVTPVPEETK